MLLALATRYWKQLAVLVALLGTFYAGRASVKTVTETKMTDKVAEVATDDKTEKDVDVRKNDKVTTIVTKTDGTKIETIVDHTQVTEKKTETDNSKTKLDETKTTDTKVTAPAAKDPYMPDYSIGAMVKANSSLTRTYEITAGYRVLGNAWVQAGYDTGGSIGLGVRVDF